MKEDDNKQEPDTDTVPDSVVADTVKPETTPTVQAKPAAPAQRSNLVAWLAVLIALAALGLGLWIWQDMQQSLVDKDRVQALGLETAANRQSLQQIEKQSGQFRQQ